MKIKIIISEKLYELSVSNIWYWFKNKSNIKYFLNIMTNLFSIKFLRIYNNINPLKIIKIITVLKYYKFGYKKSFLYKLKNIKLFLEEKFWFDYIKLSLKINSSIWNKIFENDSKIKIKKIELINNIIKYLLKLNTNIIIIYEIILNLCKKEEINLNKNDVRIIFKNKELMINEKIYNVKINKNFNKFNIKRNNKNKLTVLLKNLINYLNKEELFKLFLLKKGILNKKYLFKYFLLNNNYTFSFNNKIYLKFFEYKLNNKLITKKFKNNIKNIKNENNYRIFNNDLIINYDSIKEEDKFNLLNISTNIFKEYNFNYYRGWNYIITYYYYKFKSKDSFHVFFKYFLKIYFVRYIDSKLDFFNKIIFIINYLIKLYFVFEKWKIKTNVILISSLITLFIYYLKFENYKENKIIEDILNIFIMKSWNGLISVILVILNKIQLKLFNLNYDDIINSIKNNLFEILNGNMKINFKDEIKNYKIDKKLIKYLFNLYYNKKMEILFGI